MTSSDDGSCAVCLAEARKDGRRVPCGNGHVFCLTCLQGLVSHGKNVQEGSFPCPCCRSPVTIPPGGVASFPSAGEGEGEGGAGGDLPFRRPASRPPPAPLPAPRGRFQDRFRRRRGDARPRFFPPAPLVSREEALGFPGYGDYTGFPGAPFLPFPGPPRRMNGPFYSGPEDPFDLETDAPRPTRQDQVPPVQPPELPFLPIPRVLEQAHALSSILSGARPSLSAASADRSGRFPGPDAAPEGRRRGRRGGGRGYPGGAGGASGELGSSSDDLDMEEVMLVIAQMEQQEELRVRQLEQDQDALLRMQNEINEDEDFLEALCSS